MEKENNGFQKVADGELFKWEAIGTKLEGVLKSYNKKRTAMGDGNIYEIRTKDGITTFFAPMLLHKKLQNVAIGNIVQIEYNKKTKTGAGTDLKHFEVAFAKPDEAKLKALGIEIFDERTDDEKANDSFNGM